MTHLPSIKQALIDELQEREITESALARELGLSQQTVNHIVSGRRGIGVQVLIRILDARPAWKDRL